MELKHKFEYNFNALHKQDISTNIQIYIQNSANHVNKILFDVNIFDCIKQWYIIKRLMFV